MQLLLNSPAQIFGIAALIAFLFVFVGGGRTLDIQLHSTYIVLHLSVIALGSALLLGLNAFIYWWLPATTRVPWLTVGHVVLLLVAVFTLLLLAVIFRTLLTEDSAFAKLQRIAFRAIGLLLLGQVLGVANWL